MSTCCLNVIMELIKNDQNDVFFNSKTIDFE